MYRTHSWSQSDPRGVEGGSPRGQKGKCTFASNVFFLLQFFAPMCFGSATRGGSRARGGTGVKEPEGGRVSIFLGSECVFAKKALKGLV